MHPSSVELQLQSDTFGSGPVFPSQSHHLGYTPDLTERGDGLGKEAKDRIDVWARAIIIAGNKKKRG